MPRIPLHVIPAEAGIQFPGGTGHSLQFALGEHTGVL